MISLKTVTAGLVVPVLALYPSVGANAQSAVTLPFEADFEVEKGYSIGPITSDPAWKFGPTLDASIVTPGANTSQALQIVGADWLWLLTDSQGAQVSWVDFYTKPVFVEPLKLPEVVESAQSAVTGFVKVDAQGEVFAIDGDGSGSGT